MCVISRLPQTSDAKRVGDSSNIVCHLADTGRRLRYYGRVRKKIESEAIFRLCSEYTLRMSRQIYDPVCKMTDYCCDVAYSQDAAGQK